MKKVKIRIHTPQSKLDIALERGLASGVLELVDGVYKLSKAARAEHEGRWQ